jgi:hypothetical protein
MFVSVIGVVGGIACTATRDDNNFREDVLYCEDAVAQTKACCPDVVVPPRACTFHQYVDVEDCGCETGEDRDEEHTWPVIDVATSRSIIDKGCAELAANDGCAALGALLGRTNESAVHVHTCHSSTTGTL